MATESDKVAASIAHANTVELTVNGVVIVALIAATVILGVHNVFDGAQCVTVFTGIIAWAAGRQAGRSASRRRQNGNNENNATD